MSELSINSEALQSGFGTLFGNFVDSAFLLADPARRLFWLSILSSLVIAIIVLRLQGRPLSLKFLRRVFLSRKYWLNPSSRIDFRYFLLNSGIKAVLLTLFVSAQLAVTIAVAMILQKNLGTATPTALPWLAVACLYTFVFFVAEDLSRFLLHVGMHKLPFLWRFHRVHHSATTLTPLTLHRVHPVELCLYYARGIMVFGLVSGVFLYQFGSQLTALDILGVDALGFLFNMIGANLRHSHIWFSFGRLEKLFISPAQHQIHHSSDADHRDTNFGTCLAIWDRLFDSWRPAGLTPKKLAFGWTNSSAVNPTTSQAHEFWGSKKKTQGQAA